MRTAGLLQNDLACCMSLTKHFDLLLESRSAQVCIDCEKYTVHADGAGQIKEHEERARNIWVLLPASHHLNLHLSKGIIVLLFDLSLNCWNGWGTTGDFTTSFLHSSLFFTALRDLANSRLVYSLMVSPHLFLCPPCLLPPFTVPCKMILSRPNERETRPYHFSWVSLRWSRGLLVVRLPAGSWHGLSLW